MRANHINPLGRLKPLSYLSAAAEQETGFYHYDLTDDEDDLDIPHGAFLIEAWANEKVQDYSYEYTIFEEIFSLLWESPTARSLINFAAAKKWMVTVQPLEDAAYDLDDENGLLILNNYNLKLPTFEKPGYFRHALILSLIKGLRDIWHIECRQPYETGLSIESVLLLERVRAADCDVISLLTAWELRGDGTPEIWRHLLGAPEGDMAMRFTRALERQPGKHFDGSALIEAFHGWFENETRVAACDHQTLDVIDAHLEDAREANLYGTKLPDQTFIESLSRLPNKQYYLEGYGFGIMKDPHFCGLNDDVNQAYFLQIKREMETTTIGAVAFRDAELAARIFPED